MSVRVFENVQTGRASLELSRPSVVAPAATGGARGGRAVQGGSPIVLVYHHIARGSCRFTDLLGVTTDPDVFRGHLRHVARNYDLIAPGDLVSGKLPARPLLITFDDAYRSVLDVAGPILQEFSAPSVFFLNPGVVTTARLPLDNLLCLAMHAFGADELGRILRLPVRGMSDAIMHGASRLGEADISALRAELCVRLGGSEDELRREADLFLAPDDLPRLAAFGIEAANHSMSHAFLRCVAAPGLACEIAAAKTLIEALARAPVRFFSVPYGDTRDATPAVLDAARQSGHEAIFLVQGRPNRQRPAADVFFRISPQNIRPSLLPMSLRVLPELRRMRRRVTLPA